MNTQSQHSILSKPSRAPATKPSANEPQQERQQAWPRGMSFEEAAQYLLEINREAYERLA